MKKEWKLLIINLMKDNVRWKIKDKKNFSKSRKKLKLLLFDKFQILIKEIIGNDTLQYMIKKIQSKQTLVL